VLPESHYYRRRNYLIKSIVQFAINCDFTDLIITHEDHKRLNGLILVHLPDGPTAHFKLSSVRLHEQIKGSGNKTSHKPELILNNFNTRLGHTIGRMLASLFPQQPQFQGRQVATFHNQRDFTFFRHHRYIIDEGKDKKKPQVRLQELGPRFCLKLRSLQLGTFDTNFGEYIWTHKKEMDTSRRRFFF